MKTVAVYVFGAGGAGEHLLGFFRQGVQVLGFIDNSPAKWNTEFCGLPVFPPDVLKDGNYDYVVVCSAYHPQIVLQLVEDLGIPEQKVINTHALFHDLYFRSRLDAFTLRAREVQCIATGISYVMLGVIESQMALPTFNFAMNGQDLYYDAKILRHVLENHPVDKLEYVLVGLTRYSLHYDLSRRKNDMVTRYAHLLGAYHHGQATKDKVDRANRVISSAYMDSIYQRQRSAYDGYFKELHNGNFSQLKNKTEAQKKMELISSREHIKYYPATVAENTVILDELLGYLKAKGLRTLLFTVPGHPYYTAQVPQRIEKEFLETVAPISRKHNVPFWDMLRSPDFTDAHYYDDSHLNEAGGCLFSKMLNDILRNLNA